MSNIQVLDQITIDKIAAGEVIERPSSIVKELVENSIDAKASSVTVEIKEGGISFIRVTDNGQGIEQTEISLAFLRHSTSKIRSVEDLIQVASLGFRGEALSSIAAIAQVELITKKRSNATGNRYVIEGGIEKSLEEIGAPDGTTFLIHQMFYNTPARRKFLKTPMTEASHVNELMVRLALSHPEVSFQFITNGQTKLHTSGNKKLKDVIYNVYGREIAKDLIEVTAENPGIRINGLIGKPIISRGNRNYENYYINGRYVKSAIITKAIEDAYKGFTMQHKYPFTVLHIEMDGPDLDVNVHPTKMELRFSNQQSVYNFIYETLKNALNYKELIPRVTVPEPVVHNPQVQTIIPEQTIKQKSVMDLNKIVQKKIPNKNIQTLDYFMDKMKERVSSYHQQMSSAEVCDKSTIYRKDIQEDKIKEAVTYNKSQSSSIMEQANTLNNHQQLSFFEDHLITKDISQEYHLIGQVFSTYWLVEFKEELYIIDQHAAHERVLYERTLKGLKEKVFTSQYVNPPIILNLSMQEAQLLTTHLTNFTAIGFEIESFGGDSFAVRAVPDNLYNLAKKELLIEMLDGLSDGLSSTLAPDMVSEKIASMSCKAAVKGNSKLTSVEMNYLITELLSLDNPYHCPHGRPTIIAMTKRELEKKFKRIL